MCIFFFYLDTIVESQGDRFYQYKMQRKLWNNLNYERIQDLVYIKKIKDLKKKVNSLLP